MCVCVRARARAPTSPLTPTSSCRYLVIHSWRSWRRCRSHISSYTQAPSLCRAHLPPPQLSHLSPTTQAGHTRCLSHPSSTPILIHPSACPLSLPSSSAQALTSIAPLRTHGHTQARRRVRTCARTCPPAEWRPESPNKPPTHTHPPPHPPTHTHAHARARVHTPMT